jgi:hypothetical protein
MKPKTNIIFLYFCFALSFHIPASHLQFLQKVPQVHTFETPSVKFDIYLFLTEQVTKKTDLFCKI